MAASPEFFGVDSEVGEDDFVLHVVWGEGLVVVIDDGDGGLGSAHQN